MANARRAFVNLAETGFAVFCMFNPNQPFAATRLAPAIASLVASNRFKCDSHKGEGQVCIKPAMPPASGDGLAACCPRRAKTGSAGAVIEIAQYIGKNAAMAEIVEFIQRVDAGQQRHFLARAIVENNACADFQAW